VKGEVSMFSKWSLRSIFILLPLILILFLWGNHSSNYTYSEASDPEEAVYALVLASSGSSKNYSALDFLGLSFKEVQSLLGEPDTEGFSYLLGPHNYIEYDLVAGPVLFCSPSGIENKLAVSILLGGEHEVLGARVGMSFAEIRSIIGEPDFGPELGIDNRHYMDYHIGESSSGTPQILISFSAESINGPTKDVFLKWEAFNQYEYREPIVH